MPVFFLVLGQLFVWLVRKWSCGILSIHHCSVLPLYVKEAKPMVSIMMYNKYHLSLCRKIKETSASSLQSQLPPKAFLIQYDLRLHVPLSFSDTLFIKWPGCFGGITAFPETQPQSHMETSPGCSPLLFCSFLIITVYHYDKILFPLRVNICIS